MNPKCRRNLNTGLISNHSRQIAMEWSMLYLLRRRVNQRKIKVEKSISWSMLLMHRWLTNLLRSLLKFRSLMQLHKQSQKQPTFLWQLHKIVNNQQLVLTIKQNIKINFSQISN
jgi:hypothetical protein